MARSSTAAARLTTPWTTCGSCSTSRPARSPRTSRRWPPPGKRTWAGSPPGRTASASSATCTAPAPSSAAPRPAVPSTSPRRSPTWSPTTAAGPCPAGPDPSFRRSRRRRELSVGTASVTRATELTVRREIMTTLQNRPNTALLVVDVQSGVVDGNHERDTVVANVGALVDKARREQVPVVWVQHSSDMLEKGSEEWRIVPELAPGSAEPLVEKTYPDSVEDTTLESVLSGLAVGR